jgi:hypothetical protein
VPDLAADKQINDVSNMVLFVHILNFLFLSDLYPLLKELLSSGSIDPCIA